jgi:replicative superfamily II helicase
LILPERFPPTTEVQDIHTKLVRELRLPEAEQLYIEEGITEFNPIVSQVFNKLYLSSESVFIGAPSGSNLKLCSELAVFREIQDTERSDKIVYIAPNDDLC